MKIAKLILIIIISTGMLYCSNDNIANPIDDNLVQEIEPDLLYDYPYQLINDNDEIIFSSIGALYSSKIDESGNKNLIFRSPKGWGIIQNSISPDHQRILFTMMKPNCQNWPNEDGVNCGYGRLTLWLAYHEPNNLNDPQDDKWVLKNLSPIYGANADIHGWTSWQSNKYALFNALIRPNDQPVLGTSQEDNNAQAYQIRFDSNTDINIELWGQGEMYRPDCLIGRLYSSNPQNKDEAIDGQRIVFARRCYSEPVSNESYAWWNTQNSDGTGGKCVGNLPSFEVPILRLYIIEADINGQPKSPPKLTRQPSTELLFRQMNKTPEWGDMQPAISKNGKFVAFHTVKGFTDDTNNCAAFKEHSSSVVNYCELDDNLECKEIKQFPLPDKLPVGQGQPFFVEKDGQTYLIITEDDHTGNGSFAVAINLNDPETRIRLFEGIGGYPLK